MLHLAGIDVEAVSIGGVETCIDLPRHGIAFDIGRAPDFSIVRERIFFTHAHVDHMAGVVWHCSTRKLRGMRPPTYVIGPENEAAFREMFDVWRRLDRSEMPHELVVVGPGDEVVLDAEHVVRVFRSPHRAPCQGYALVSRRRKLRPEFHALAPDEIRTRRVRGDDMFDVQETVEVAFPGDTLIDVVENEEVVRNARLLVLEVTFIDERVSVEKARSTGHVHLFEVAERADLFQNEALLLTHFSPRYSREQIVDAIDRVLPKHLRDRCTPLLAQRT